MLELGLHVRAPLGCLGFHLGLHFFRMSLGLTQGFTSLGPGLVLLRASLH